jgi:DNA-binding CsgD family transcriptional regulator
MILIAVFSLFLLNGKFDIPFVVYNTISLLILLCCTISYYVLNDKEMHYKQEPKSKVSRLFITFMFFTILLTMFSLTITTMLPQYYQNANIYIFFGQILTAFILEILRRKKVHFLNMIGVCFIIIVAGIVLFAIGKLLPIACILLGAASAISVLGIFIGGYVFSKYKSRFIPPLTIVLSGIAVGIGEMVYDYFAESLQIYMYIMMGIYVFAASIYLFLSPFIQYRMGYVIEVPFKDSDEKENLKNFEEIIIENDQKNIKESGLNVFSSLTEREKEVVKLILWGYTGNQIAATLFISLSTVKTHISNIYSKLLIKSKKELFDLARQGNSGDNMFPGQNF